MAADSSIFRQFRRNGLSTIKQPPNSSATNAARDAKKGKAGVQAGFVQQLQR